MASSNLLALTRYRQGEWFGVVRNGTMVLLGPETPHALIDTVWELLDSAPEAHEVLHEVTEAFGVSLSRIPPFGIIDSKDALRVFLRGDLELLVQLGGGREHLTGRDVTTWTERRIVGATSFSLHIGASPTDGTDRPLLDTLPLKDGVVLLASLEAAGQDAVAGAPAIVGEKTQARDEPATANALSTPTEPPAPPKPEAVSDVAVSDETVIGYTDADLGLTIAPGQAHASAESTSVDPTSAEPTSAEPSAGPDSSAEAPLEEPAAAGHVAAVEAEGEDPVSQAEPEAAEGTGTDIETASPDPAPDEEAAAPGDSDAADVPVHTSTTDPVSPSLENTTNYDHLWDKTVMRTIEDAAVRLHSDSDDHDAPVSQAPGPQPPSAPETPSGTEQTAAEPLNVPLNVPPAPTSAPAAGQSDSPGGGLIDSVPWLRSGPSSPPPADPAPQVPAAWTPAPAGVPMDEDSDHDGQTIMKSSLSRVDDAGVGGTAGDAAALNGPSVLARVCSKGHANPPTYPLCSVCGVPISGDAVHVPRPRLGRMRLSTGELIDLDQSLIIGRQPSVSRVQGGTMPRLVQVESPGGDISRSHVEVRLEGWHVMLCDLKATNGTVLIREGQAPRRLAQNEMAILLDGDIAELGDDISLRFEEIL